MKVSVFRPLQLAVLGFLLSVVAALISVGVLSWRNEQRLGALQKHVEHMEAFQTEFLDLEGLAVDHFTRGSEAERSARERLDRRLQQITELGYHIDPDTPAKLARARALLRDQEVDPDTALQELRQLFAEVSAAEDLKERRLVEAMTRDIKAELHLAVFAPALLLGLGATILFFLRRRIFTPLRSLELLLSRVAGGEFTPVPAEGVEPLLYPLFRNYNDLVTRLQELEEAHRSHAASLEREVRVATGALLEQQLNLARAERLAATGELAASVAHELRNPLAAIQMALKNLVRDVDNPDLAHRLDLVNSELARLGRLLNDMLNRARHAPERARTFRLAEVVRQLLDLTRYQLPPGVVLEQDIPDNLVCQLPEDSLRQALLNLILNAARAFPDEAGTVRISASRKGSRLELAVEDDGPGFAPAVIGQGIRPFFSTRQGGTGLGLAIVNRFAREVGGRVELSNRKPRGARVELHLPRRVNHE